MCGKPHVTRSRKSTPKEKSEVTCPGVMMKRGQKQASGFYPSVAAYQGYIDDGMDR